MKSREQRENFISDMCDQHGCKTRVRKIHFEQYVDRGWHPHPPQSFINWWNTTHPGEPGMVSAFNSKFYLDQWEEAKQCGAA
jgi:hypothetical protein